MGRAALVRTDSRAPGERAEVRAARWPAVRDRTALAAAEVEYETHTSPSIYVEFPLSSNDAGLLPSRVPALTGRQVSVLIWTTTPWTIPSNLAIAFHPDVVYGAYEYEHRV